MVNPMTTAGSEANVPSANQKSSSLNSKTTKLLLKAGGLTGGVGGLLVLAANGLHPHPREFQLETVLLEVAQSSAWGGLHLTLIFGLILIFGMLLAITLTLKGEPGATIARFAGLTTVLGGTLILVSTAVDGFAKNQLARLWFESGPTEKGTLFRIAEAVENVQYAIYSLSVVVFLGIGIFLYGLATILGSGYPKGLGWLAGVAGVGEFVVGVAQLLGGPTLRTTEIFFVLFSVLSTFWVLVMSVLMWRKTRGEQVNKGIS